MLDASELDDKCNAKLGLLFDGLAASSAIMDETTNDKYFKCGAKYLIKKNLASRAEINFNLQSWNKFSDDECYEFMDEGFVKLRNMKDASRSQSENECIRRANLDKKMYQNMIRTVIVYYKSSEEFQATEKRRFIAETANVMKQFKICLDSKLDCSYVKLSPI